MKLQQGICGYINAGVCGKLLDRIQNPKPQRPQYSPNLWTLHSYVKRLQIAPNTYEIDLIDKKITKIIQYIAGIFYIMPGQLIQQCCKRSMKYQGSSKNQQGKPRENPQFYQIIWQHTQMKLSVIKPVTWSFMWTQTWRILLCQRQEVVILEISI